MGNIYFGVNNVARKVKKIYFGVNNVARKVKKVYIGINNVARLVWQDDISVIVATIGDGWILRSVNKGQDWTRFLIMTGTTSGGLTQGNIRSIIYDDAFHTAYNAGGSIRYAYSADGSGAWNYVELHKDNFKGMPSGIVKNGSTITIASNTYSSRNIFRSTDNGKTFSSIPVDFSFSSTGYNVIANKDNTIVITTNQKDIYRSTNMGSSWTAIIVDSSNYGTRNINCVNGWFYLSSYNSDNGNYHRWRSSDGVTWTSLAAGGTVANNFPHCSRYCNNKYYMGINDYSCFYSTNGTAFTKMSTTDLGGTWSSSNDPMYTGTHYAMVNYEGGSSSSSTKYSWFARIVNVTDSEWTFRQMYAGSSDAHAFQMTYSQPGGTL